MFVKGDDVIFSEVSPRPHDTGLVTLISQDLSEFALHVRAILGLVFGPASSLTGIALPRTDEAVGALRWTAGGGGGDAAPWIHLVAVTLGLYVVGPRHPTLYRQ